MIDHCVQAMKKFCTIPLWLTLFNLTIVGSAQATTFADITNWVGNGSNEAALAIDWNDGKSPEVLLWGYRWDGTATGEDMLTAIVSSDPHLYATVSPPGMFGVSVYGLGYDVDQSGFSTNPSLSFTNGIATLPTSTDADDNRLPTDAGDHYLEGWLSGFWGYYVGGEGVSPAWTSASSGISGRTLADGSWDGFSFAPNFAFTNPSVIPEPSCMALAVCSLLALLTRRSER